MKLTIIPSDSFIAIDGYSIANLNFNDVPENIHALQWDDSNGHIEYKNDDANTFILELPSWSEQLVLDWKSAKNSIDNAPKPSPDDIEEFNKALAKSALSKTDWSVLPDVELKNAADFIFYRAELRKFIFNPSVDPVFLVEPKAIW